MKIIYSISSILILLSFFYEQSSAQWVISDSGRGSYQTLDFVNSNTGYIAGNFVGNSMVLKTTNQGQNWISLPTNITFLPYDIDFGTENFGCIVGDIGNFMITTNGGNNWVTGNGGSNYNYKSVCFINDLKGWVVGKVIGSGNSTCLSFTTNGGVNWTTYSPFLGCSELNQIFFIDENTGWVAGGYSTSNPNFDHDVIGKTTNGGLNWEVQTSTSDNYIMQWIQFINHNTGYAIGKRASSTNSAIYKTTNGGTNWNISPISGGLTRGYFVNENTGWVSGGEMYGKTTDGGLNWATQYNFHPQVRKFHFINSLTGFFVGSYEGYGVFKTINGAPIGIQQINHEVPGSFSLKQNYPNPFNPSTQIEFNISKTSFVVLKVFDVLGKQLEIVVEQELSSGIYKVDFNATKYPSGLYFYRIETKDYSESKKMMLIK